jgi:hypothetical protein
MKSPHLSRVLAAAALCTALGVPAAAPVWAGPGQPGETLSERVERDIAAVLGRHGLAAGDSAANPWLTLRTGIDLVGIGEVFYLLELHRIDEVPLAARVEIIEYCMRLHDEAGVPYLRLQMRPGPREATLLPPRPAFEMAVGSLY